MKWKIKMLKNRFFINDSRRKFAQVFIRLPENNCTEQTGKGNAGERNPLFMN